MANTSAPERFLRVPDVLAIRGDGRSSLYNEVAAGLFTRPLHLGRRRSVWPASEVDALQRARIASKTPDDIRHLVKALEAKRATAADGLMPERGCAA